jgi:hypothetical protein
VNQQKKGFVKDMARITELLVLVEYVENVGEQ